MSEVNDKTAERPPRTGKLMEHDLSQYRLWRKRLNAAGIIVLLVGLTSAVIIYATADNGEENVVDYEVIGKNVYPAMHEKSKKYIHDLEMFGGKDIPVSGRSNKNVP